MAEEKSQSSVQKPMSGADPNLEDAMKAKEKELVKMNHGADGGEANPDENADDLHDSDGFLSQADDPESQQS
jgi:hypothetical protein